MSKIKIALVDDEILFRRGMTMILNEDPTLRIVVEAENGQDLLQKLKNLQVQPDIILMDLEMPEMNGVDCTRTLHERRPEIKIIALSSHHNMALISNMLKIGVAGYLAKNSPPEEVLKTIREVYDRGFYYDHEVMKAFRSGIQDGRSKSNDYSAENVLSKRELDVLRLICAQYTTSEIAERLFISPRTVDGHRNNLLEKTEAKNVVGLVLYAFDNELVAESMLKRSKII